MFEGKQLGFLRGDDDAKTCNLFAKICMTAIEPFSEKWASEDVDNYIGDGQGYHWAQEDLVGKMTELAKDAIFTFKRAPPREAVFLDRKMVGTYTLLVKLGLRMGPRKLIYEYLKNV